MAAASVLPMRANNYVVEELIDWSNIPDDPIFQLVFPQPGMLSILPSSAFNSKINVAMAKAIKKTSIHTHHFKNLSEV